jgi:hypothetical protein
MKYTMLYLPNGLSDSFFFLSLTPFFFYSFSPIPYIFHPFRLHSVFLPVPFSPSLSFCYIHSTCAQLSLSPHCKFSTFFPLLASSTSSFPHLNLAIIFLCLAFSPPGTPEFPLEYTSHRELYLVSLILSLLSCFSVSLSLSPLSSTFIHLHFALNPLLLW